ncbi:hypothetical protein ACH40E_02850 [Streptomyces acidicola]|uniref:hypothetical protein n=1 Tax=Streptomyces acidicola TaxID=2596892 RepID=UPI0037B4D31E
MADDVTITVHVRDLTGPGFNSVNRNINQLQRNANQMGAQLRIVGGHLDDVANAAGSAGQSFGGGSGLRGQLIGVAGALGSTLLPSLGALAPMLTGVAAVGGGAALAMDDLKKKAKELKRPFEEWQKVAEKAVAPHTEKAVKSLKGAMKDLTPVIETGAETFGRITEKAAKFADSPAFKGALAKNAEMGSRWVEEFAGSVGTFTQAFLDFGTKSKPALDAWQNLLGGLLDRGLPGMFKELEQGISGSSDFLDGLAYVINDSLLPSLGKIAGSFSEAFGPLLGEMLIGAGNAIKTLASGFEVAMEALEPIAGVVADAFRALNDVFSIGAEVAGSFAKNVGGELMRALLSIAGVDVSNLGNGFRGFSDWVKANEGQIRAAFFNIAGGITDMVATGIGALPQLFGAFRQMTDGVLLAIDGLVSGLATAFGDLPVIGDKFKEWDRNFDGFASGFRDKMGQVGAGIDKITQESIPALNRAKLKMNIDEAQANLDTIKQQLKDPALTKERKAKLTADKQDAEEKLAAARRELSAFDRKKATAKLDANGGPFWSVMGAVRRAGIPTKTGKVNANTGGFWSAVRGISGRVLGTSYINVVQRITRVANSLNPFRAMGGPVPGYAGGGDVQHFPNGGYVDGPGGPRSDSILATFASGATARVSDTEYVVQSSAVKKYGLAFMDALNSGRLKVAALAAGGVTRLAKGGLSASAKQARNELADAAQTSHFGRMARYKFSPMEKELGRPADLGSLVSSLNGMRGDIKRAFSGGTESRLLRQLNSAGAALIKYEKQLTSVNKSLETARNKLNDLKGAASQLKDSVKSGILSGANITRAAGGEGQVTINTLLSQMTADAANSKQFASMLDQLKKKGLDKGLIEEIAQAGITGGGMETAAAILGGGDAEIKRLTELRHQIVKSAKDAGATAADAMYGAGIRAAEGLVKGLEKKQDAIEGAMMRIAKSMEKAIKKALGIKSPSKVMEQVGDFTAEGFAVGMKRNRSVTPAWESMLNQPRGTGQARAAATTPGSVRSGERPIVLNVSLGGREFGQIWVDVGRKEVATRGGLTATLGRP